MEEFNKKTLIESLFSLPEHEPPEQLWDAIETEMKTGEGSGYTRQQLRELPTHEPPADLWGSIEEILTDDARKGGKIIPLGMRRMLAVAASLALLLSAYFVFDLSKNEVTTGGSDFTISYSSETADDQLFNADWNEDEDAFEEFKMLCEAKQYICEHPEFQVLKSDLDELTHAKMSIQEAIGNYGTDPDLVIQIKEIELERTDILKKMMVMLI